MSAESVERLLEAAQSRHRDGALAEAEAIYRQALGIDPRHAPSLHGLGIAVYQQGRIVEAIESLQQAAALSPDVADFHANSGVILAAAGRHDEAIAAFRSAIQVDPEHVEAHYNLGESLQKTGQLKEAIDSYRQAVNLYPDFPEAQTSLGRALLDFGDAKGAVAALRLVIELLAAPSAAALNNLGMALRAAGMAEEAAETLRRASEMDPNYASAWINLGNVLKDSGELDAAIECYDKAAMIEPNYFPTHSNRLYAMHFHPGFDAEALYREHVNWRRQFVDPLKLESAAHLNERSADRRLRIGYVSPDFRQHVVGWNLLPLMRHHDHTAFEIFCYSDVKHDDAMTEQLRAGADVWRNTAALSHPALAEMIRSDWIDVLVDLALHTSGNRLLTFARRPAPVQVTWLGYCGTTGLDAIDFRLSDPHIDPPDGGRLWYVEQTVRLPATVWCYQPGGATPEVDELPALSNGWITFGCLNNFAKVSAAATELWAEILCHVPRSRLIVHSPPGGHREKLLAIFASRGVGAERIEFVPRARWPVYVGTYQRMDVSLDPFPFGGGITTCDSLWMGVPVVTLSGGTAVGRGGRSVLTNVGLSELVAISPDEYVRKAVELAGDLPRLSRLRAELRQRLAGSPVMDAHCFARDIECAYLAMWHGWRSSDAQK